VALLPDEADHAVHAAYTSALPDAPAAFVTASEDRDSAASRKATADLAWGSFAWCLSEPAHLIAFAGRHVGRAALLHRFVRSPRE
jgi:hypothetical protein